ncbi:DUF3624 domain-containing protein [Thaumasiovibrio subtropicus]|uniref:DUF3624 domain-containing protein n=1 Tax=Thaumasiovibrio subtropicus TaxID=1891207 RepID=UPI000B351431|nr:DUF3624 domain-containing protein [Thaumasiovibrio subtropicus]
MSCRFCDHLLIKEKLGRCHRCMKQLVVLAILSWSWWGWGYSATPFSVESIALLFFAGAFSLLLSAHMVMALYYRLKKTT